MTCTLYILIPIIKMVSPMSFIEKNFPNQVLISCNMGMSFWISNMTSTYNTINDIMLTLTFLYTQCSTLFLMNPYCFTVLSKRRFQLLETCLNRLITIICILSWSRKAKTFKLCHVHILKKILIKENSFHIHLSNFIIIVCNNSK